MLFYFLKSLEVNLLCSNISFTVEEKGKRSAKGKYFDVMGRNAWGTLIPCAGLKSGSASDSRFLLTHALAGSRGGVRASVPASHVTEADILGLLP